MRVYVPVEFNDMDSDGTMTCMMTAITPEPSKEAILLFTEWLKDGSGAWLTWRVGDYHMEHVR